jgi:hypothetical protein
MQSSIKERYYSLALNETSSNNNDTTYTLIGDTLFTNQDFKIVVGQPIIIGKASDERDWYKTITFKSGASWPLVFLQKVETRQNMEYQLDPSIREKDKVKEYLTPGDTLFVTKIKRFGSKRFRNYWYTVTMGQKLGLLSLTFKCDIMNAIKYGEVILPSK